MFWGQSWHALLPSDLVEPGKIDDLKLSDPGNAHVGMLNLDTQFINFWSEKPGVK